MLALAVAFATSLAISLAVTPAVRDFALRRKLVDAADSSRKVHTRRIPRLGGVAMLCAFFAGFPLAFFFDDAAARGLGDRSSGLLALAGGAAVLGLLGAVDDVRGVGPRRKLLVQCAVAAVAFTAGIRITVIALPGLGTVSLGMLALPVTMSWIVGVVNAVNLIDGLDGLAAGISLLALGSGIVLSVEAGNLASAVVLAAGAGAVLGFLRYNFHPATIFMGDAGSMFLGYLLAVSAIATPRDRSPGLTVGVSFALVAVPLADTTIAIVRRILRGRSVFSADREHIHHLLLDAGISHRRVVLLLCGVSATFCAVALAVKLVGGRVGPLVALAVCAGALLELRRLGLLGWDKARRLGEERRLNRARRMAVRGIASSMRRAATVSEVLDTLAPMPPALLASGAVASVPDAGLRRDFRCAAAVNGSVFRARFPIGNPSLGNVEVHWSDGRDRIDRDDEIAIQHICDCVEKAVRKIGRRAAPLVSDKLEGNAARNRNLAVPSRSG